MFSSDSIIFAARTGNREATAADGQAGCARKTRQLTLEMAPRNLWLAVAALLASYAVLAFTASLTKGLSFDEAEQLAVGYNIWLRNDYRIEGANGDLVKRWATMPYLFTRPHFLSTDDPFWRNAEPYRIGDRFLFGLGNQPELLLAQGRAMIVLLGVIMGCVLFASARELFGWRAGLVALALFCFSPHMLAFGGIVSTDLSITLTLFTSTWCIWKLLHQVTVARLIASLAVFGLLLLAKMTALVIFPITIVLIVARLARGDRITARWSHYRWEFTAKRNKAALIAFLIFAHALAGWGAIWAHYGFRYRASPNPQDAGIVLRKQAGRDGAPLLLLNLVSFSQRTHFLPEGFCKGVDWLLGDDDLAPAFMNGAWTIGGWPLFFPYAIWAKTPPAIFALIAVGVIVWWKIRGPHGAGNRLVTGLYAATPWLALVGVYLIVAMTEDLNLGHRHVLPIYPALYVLAGGVTLGWKRWPRVTTTLVVLLVSCHVAGSLRVRPDYLAYFGPQVGGVSRGYQHLVDSSLDWGMNLPGLKQWLDRNNPGDKVPVFLAYFGTDNPDYYGIRCQRLPGFLDVPRNLTYAYRPGFYAISATLFQGVYLAAFGQWNSAYEQLYQGALSDAKMFERAMSSRDVLTRLVRERSPGFWQRRLAAYDNLRFARLCAWLRHQGAPPHHVGHAMFIWKLDIESLRAALLGPPLENGKPSPQVQRYLAHPR